MTEFKYTSEMFDAGYCVQQYSANPNDGDLWLFRGEIYETPRDAVQSLINKFPHVYIASRSDVLAARVSHG